MLRTVIHEVLKIEFVDENDIICYDIGHIFLLLILSWGYAFTEQHLAMAPVWGAIRPNSASASITSLKSWKENGAYWEGDSQVTGSPSRS